MREEDSLVVIETDHREASQLNRAGHRKSGAIYAGFGLLCLLLGSRWLLEEAVVASAPTEVVELISFLLLLLAGLWKRNGTSWGGVGVGMMLVGVPGVVLRWGGKGVPSVAWAAGMAGVPVVMAVVEGRRAMLLPAVAGLAGVLFLLPVDLERMYRDPLGAGAVVVTVAAVGAGIVWGHVVWRRMSAGSAVVGMAIAGLGVSVVDAVVEGAFSRCSAGALVAAWPLWGAEVMVLGLTVLLVRGMEPVRYGARFLLVPLVAAVEGVVVLRPEVTLRQGVGAVLMTGASVWLLRGRLEEGDEGLRLR